MPDCTKSMLRAYSMTNSSFNNQAQLSAYVDDFRYLALLLAFCVPIAFMRKKVSAGEGAA